MIARERLVRLRDTLTQPYRTIKMSYPIWYYVLNWKPRKLFRENPVVLSSVQERIVGDLKRQGIAFTSLEELFPEQNLLPVLQAKARELRPYAEQVTTKKPFILEHWEAVPTLSLDNPFTALSLDPRILAIVNSYFGLWAKFYYFMLGLTLPIGEHTGARASQRWHRDFEETKMCKLFVYLNDVGEDAGPFTYIRGSQLGGKWRSVYPQRPGRGHYPPDGAVDRVVPETEMTICTGKAGTVIFADTSGLHRGGYATKNERLMFTAGYNSSAAYGVIRYHLPRDMRALDALPPVARYALRGFPASREVE